RFLCAASVTPLAAAPQQQRGVPRGCSAAAATTSANVERAEGLSGQRHAIKTFFLGVFLRSLQRDQVLVLGSSSFGGGSYTIFVRAVAPRLFCQTQKCPAQVFKLGPLFRITLALGLGQQLGRTKQVIIPRGHLRSIMSFYARYEVAMQHFQN